MEIQIKQRDFIALQPLVVAAATRDREIHCALTRRLADSIACVQGKHVGAYAEDGALPRALHHGPDRDPGQVPHISI